jgi:hypothetical protein
MLVVAVHVTLAPAPPAPQSAAAAAGAARHVALAIAIRAPPRLPGFLPSFTLSRPLRSRELHRPPGGRSFEVRRRTAAALIRARHRQGMIGVVLLATPPTCSPSAYVGETPARVYVLVACNARVAEVRLSSPGLRSATIRTSLRARGRACAGIGTVTCDAPFGAGRAFRVDARSPRPLRAGAPLRIVVTFADGQRDARRLTLLEPAADDD